jgi:hypothetical protein
MGKFTEGLWRELERERGADLAQIARPAAKPGLRARPRLLAGTTVGLAGIVAALALVLSAASSSPAFAVSRNHDGTVTLRIRAVRGILGANARLAELGIRARAVQVTADCRPPAGAPAALRAALDRARGRLVHANWARAGVIAEARIDPRKIPAGHILVLPALRVGREVRLAPSHAVRGQVPGCFPFPPAAAAVPTKTQGVICHAGAAVVSISPARVVPAPGGGGGNSGNSGAPPKAVQQRLVECRPGGAAPLGNSGNSGSR